MKIIKKNIRTFTFVEEGLISLKNIGEGRIIPTLVVDFGNNQDIIDLLKVHASIEAGDVTLLWGRQFFNQKEIFLIIRFSQPIVTEFMIRFNIKKDFVLIDGVIQSKGLLLRGGKKGDKISKIQADTIIIEVPEMDMKAEWEKIFYKTLTKKYRESGNSKKKSQNKAMEEIKEIRNIWKFRK